MIYADLAGDRTPDVFAYGWALVLGALMMVRRRFPLSVLALTVAGLFIYYVLGYPAIGLGVPISGALLSAAQFRPAIWPILVAGATVSVSYGVRLAQGQDFGRIIGFELIGDLGLMLAAIALGMTLRLQAELRLSSLRLIAATAEQERSRAITAAAEERSEIARELHDSLGHHATVIAMHADVVRENVSLDRDVAAESAVVVKRTSQEMLTELRRTVGALRRREGAGPREVPSLSMEGLQRDVFDRLPLTVDVQIDIDGDIPRSVQSAAHRILQESLTNVVKHSQAKTAKVSISWSPAGLRLVVQEPGPARNGAGAEPGFGLHGMRERAQALGGSVTARPEGSGFLVEALLPGEQKGSVP